MLRISVASLISIPVILAGLTAVHIPESVPTPEPILFERIITEEADLITGVPIDYRYNDTSTDTRASSPGCPENEGGYPWLHYRKPGENLTKCFLSGVRGPCDENQLMVGKDYNSKFGVCTCDCFEMDEDDNFKVEVDDHNPDKLCISYADSQLRVFTKKEQKCVVVYEQGFCKSGEWLAATPDTRPNGWDGPRIWAGRAFCEKRKCEDEQIPDYSESSNDSGKNFTCSQRWYPMFGLATVDPADCEARGERYSKLLRKCIQVRHKKHGSVLG